MRSVGRMRVTGRGTNNAKSRHIRAATPDEIASEVVRQMSERYREQLPLIDGAVEAVPRPEPLGGRSRVRDRLREDDDLHGRAVVMAGP